ncbi:MAG: hypothetical protein CMH83_17865 [Nocardioides sp.]|nr:hypothetical protein [Nocardioides sp.]
MTDVLAPPPDAPGALGTAPSAYLLGPYLTDLDTWVRTRRHELDRLDQAALAAGRGQEVADDTALAMSLWKAVSDRYRLMWATWDGGRVLDVERERIATLIHGRLDGTAGSVPEACRLCDALVAQLRVTLSLAPAAHETAADVARIRAQLERVRDQLALEPEHGRQPKVDRLAQLLARLQQVSDKAGRGADVGGLLGPLENDAAVFERDLIVGNARRREARDQVLAAREQRTETEARAAALAVLAAECVRTVQPAPRYAVPDVAALGEVPVTPDEIGPYRERLDRVGQALTMAQDAYAGALAEHEQLVGLLDAYVAKATALGYADRGDLRISEQRAREVLERRPAPMPVCRQLVATYQAWLEQAPHVPAPADHPTGQTGPTGPTSTDTQGEAS